MSLLDLEIKTKTKNFQSLDTKNIDFFEHLFDLYPPEFITEKCGYLEPVIKALSNQNMDPVVLKRMHHKLADLFFMLKVTFAFCINNSKAFIL